MEGTRASDEVIDEIALIAMLRLDAERHGGGASSGAEALRKLHELRDREQKALQSAEDKTVHQANLDVLHNEIRKVQSLSGRHNNGGGGGERHARPRPQQQQQQRKDGGGGGGGGGGGQGHHNQARNKNRRNQNRQNRP